MLDRDEFPIVLGGDCSIVLGSMLALRRRGRYGLLFVDGHADFYKARGQPERRQSVAALTRSELDGFFVHVDADCLHDDVMPAVDYRLADGLTPAELTMLLRTAIASGRAVGIEITIYNPNLDPDGAVGRQLAEILVAALS